MKLVTFVSTFWTLEPGDLITTASPMAGPIYPGDVIESEIEGIGVLRNPVDSVKVDPAYAQRIALQYGHHLSSEKSLKRGHRGDAPRADWCAMVVNSRVRLLRQGTQWSL